tara:strand:- start:762 stop:2726 length:1965 start_codon:yes stop_codon:yes gene_type:complete
MAENQVRIIFGADTKGIDAALKKVGSRLNQFGQRASKLGKELSTKLSLPLLAAGGAAIKFASDFNESLNKVDVAFGKSQDHVKDFAKTALRQFGIAEGSALDMAALFGDMATSMGLTQESAAGMSTELVGLAGDLASFKNIDIEQATTALAGVFTGETESLKRLGIVMTEVNLKQFAMEKGLNANIKSMTQAEKVALRYQFIMSKTSNAQGDFARTGGGAANQMRIFQEALKQLAANFGQILLPTFTKILLKLNAFIIRISEMTPETKKFVAIVGGLGIALPPIAAVLPSIAKGLGLMGGAVKFLLGPLGLVLGSLTSLTVILPKVDEALKVETTLFQKLKNVLTSGMGPGAALSYVNKTLKDGVPKIDENKDAVDDLTTSYDEFAKKIQTLMAFENLGVSDDTATKEKITQEKIATNRKNFLTDVFAITDEGQSAIEERFNRFAKATSEPLDVTNNALKRFNINAQKELQAAAAIAQEHGAIIIGGFRNMASGIGSALADAITSGGNLAHALASVLLNTLGSMAIQLGNLAIKIGLAMKAIKLSFKNPFTAIAAGIALIAVGKLIQNAAKIVQGGGVKKFAKGGIVSTPTLGLMGEYPGARSNPEVIAPLDRLKSMMGDSVGSMVQVGGEFTLRGQDLVVALQRANRNRDRIN